MKKNYYQMLSALLAIKKEGRFNKEHLDEILDAIATGVDYGLEDAKDDMDKYDMLHLFHEKLGIYAIPSWKWLQPFAEMLKGKKVLEFGAGTGLLTAALRRQGVNINAVDNQGQAWSHIQCLLEDMKVCDGLEYLEKHGNDYDVLFIPWPYMDDTCLLACRKFGGGKEIFYLGEPGFGGDCGCTANASFFLEFNLEEVEVQYRPLWGLHDYLYRVIPKRGA